MTKNLKILMPMAQGGREQKRREGERGEGEGAEIREGGSRDSEDEEEVREMKSQVRCP